MSDTKRKQREWMQSTLGMPPDAAGDVDRKRSRQDAAQDQPGPSGELDANRHAQLASHYLRGLAEDGVSKAELRRRHAVLKEYFSNPGRDNDDPGDLGGDAAGAVTGRRLPAAPGVPVPAPSLDAMLASVRDQLGRLRASVPLEERSATFYTYMVPNNAKLGQFFTGTPQTEQARATVERDRRTSGESTAAAEQGSEFSLLRPAVGKPPPGSRKSLLDRTRVSLKWQGPHTVAHVLIGRLITHAVPDGGDDAFRARWERLELAFNTQVDPPETVAGIVSAELQADAPLSGEREQRLALATTRYQELFNLIEANLNLGYECAAALDATAGDTSAQPLHQSLLAEDLALFRHTRESLAELMELAPFGSYDWMEVEKASHEDLKGKGESGSQVAAALDILQRARGTQRWPEALRRCAAKLSGLVDGASGRFADQDAFERFLCNRLELLGVPEDSDLLLDALQAAKG
jgi:hypothetical protein